MFAAGGSGIMLPIIIVIIIVVVIILVLIGMYNSLVKLRNRVEEAFATMDVYMKKRFDLVPNLVETVKGYASHESATLEKVVQARSMIQSAGTPEQRMQGEAALTTTLRSLFAVAEGYPELKANTNFMGLQTELSGIEDEIAQSRKYYNAIVRDYNTKTETFPSMLIANMFKFERKPSFEIADDAERNAPKVQF
ncbi:MAG: LemA family protein [Clostridiales Family XIII bacterium]|jgi:LemA protein|nr:LemA family protein [Clostridiales Family XIII bacterium]